MCLIVFALNKHPKYRLILAANRDEFFNRPTKNAGFWIEDKSVLGGRDKLSKGTWLGITKSGRFIAITNYRDPTLEKEDVTSRGIITKEYLLGKADANSFISKLSTERNLFNGFNVIMSDDACNSLCHYSNITNKSIKLSNDIHGLSNHLLNTNWPKVNLLRNDLMSVIESESFDIIELIKILKNESFAADNALPNTGISFDLERKLSPVFISLKGYGTRCSTALLLDYNNELSFMEVSYNENTEPVSEKYYTFKLKS